MSSHSNIFTQAAVTALPLGRRARKDATSGWRTQTVSTQATLAALAALLVGLTAAGEGAAQPPPAKEGPLYPALCRPSSAKLEILSPTGWTTKLPPGQTSASVQYRVKVSPGLIDARCAEHYPYWQPAGWTVKTLFGRVKEGDGGQQEHKSEFEFKDVTDVAWQASGTATLEAGRWVMLSQVVLPEAGLSKSVTFNIEQEQVSGPPKTAKTDRGGPRRRVRVEPEEAPPAGKEETEQPSEGTEDAKGPGAVSDLLSKIPEMLKGKDSEKSGDPSETGEPTGDPAQADPSGDAKETKGDAKEPKGPASRFPEIARVPKLVPKAKLVTPKTKLATTTNPQRVKLPATKLNTPMRSKLVCRRVGSNAQRHCLRR